MKNKGFLRKKKIKKQNLLREDKFRDIDTFLFKEKESKKREELRKDIESNQKLIEDENFINRYLEDVKKVEDLITKMEKKKEADDFSFITLLRRKNTPTAVKSISEFFEKNPFEVQVIGNPQRFGKTHVIQNFTQGLMRNSMASKINLTSDEPTIAESFEDIFPQQKEKENKEYTLISEMEAIHNKERSAKNGKNREWMFTGIAGFDELLEKGIPVGSNVIIAGGPGCGKTIFCSQVIYNKALEGKDCVFLSMEERPDRLRDHMKEFGFKVTEIETSDEQIILSANGKGRIALKRLQPIRLARSIEALLEKASGTLPIDIDLVLDFVPKNFNPYLLVLDSISAIETAFSGTRRQYRIYIEQLFRYFEELDITTFMITESSDAPHKFSSTGVEEFLADGIFVFYNFPGVKKRTRGIEIYKLRGAPHSQKIMALNISNSGIEILPDQSNK